MIDCELLQEYVERKSESAFAELVRRHATWVHAAAQRQVRDTDLAQDVTQAVFIALAKKAPRLRSDGSLAGWLFKAMRYAAGHARRSESRRKHHERQASAMMKEDADRTTSFTWESLAPELNDFIGSLRRKDREAILIHFYQQKTFAEVGQAMNVSEEAARKRTSRAVERLRSMFASSGMVSPLSTSLTAAMNSNLSNLPDSAFAATTTKAVFAAVHHSATGGTQLLVDLIVRRTVWVRAMMSSAIVTAVVIGLGVVIIAGAGDKHPIAQSPALPSTAPSTALGLTASPIPPNGLLSVATPIANNLRIARWDVLLNTNGVESIDALDNQIVRTPSKIYSAAIFNADALRAAINAAAAVDGLAGASVSMKYVRVENRVLQNEPPLDFYYLVGRTMRAGLQGMANGAESYGEGENGQVHIVLDYSAFNVRMSEFDPNQRNGRPFPVNQSASISYDGAVIAGDALTFSATIKDQSGASFRHIIVWEVFAADRAYDFYLAGAIGDSASWYQLGPQSICHEADVSIVWGSQANHKPSDVSPKWERRLDDGKFVRLTGITRADKWNFCCWDGDGQPIHRDTLLYADMARENHQVLFFTAEVSGPIDEWKMPHPSGQHFGEPTQPCGLFNDTIVAAVGKSGNAVVGVPVGPWIQLGEVREGGTIKIDNEIYWLTNVRSSRNGITASFVPRGVNMRDGDLIQLSAVGKDGVEIDTLHYETTMSLPGTGPAFGRFEGMSLSNLKTFHVWKRRRQWVTFAGFATAPIIPPKDQVTKSEVESALAQEKEQARKPSNVQRRQWASVQADPSTPMGALKSLFESAGKNDASAVRARLKESGPNSDSTLDDFATFLTTTQIARHSAIERFGQEQVETLQNEGADAIAPPPFADLEMELALVPWRMTVDGDVAGSGLAMHKGEDGSYNLDITSIVGQSDGAHGRLVERALRELTAHLKKINTKLLDDPSFTFNALRLTLEHACSQSTASAKASTQPAKQVPSHR